MLTARDFFDLNGDPFAGLFESTRYVWEALDRIHSFLKEQGLGSIHSEVPAGAHISFPDLVLIEPGVVIEPGAFIQGPCWIREGSTIRHGAYIRGNVLIGKGCVFGHATEAKNSVLMDGANAAHFAYLGDSILGYGVNLGAGTRCANLRFDREEIVIRVEGEAYETKRHKLGAILGDFAQTGCNAVLNPGTLFGKGAACLPCRSVGGWVPPGALV